MSRTTRKLCLLLLSAFISCLPYSHSHAAGLRLVQADTLIGIYTAQSFSSSTISGDTISNVQFIDCNFDNASIHNMFFDCCTFTSQSIVSGLSLRGVTFNNCTLKGLMLANATLENVNIADSNADNLVLLHSTISRLSIKNSIVAVFSLRNCTNVDTVFFDRVKCHMWSESSSNIKTLGFDASQIESIHFEEGFVTEANFTELDPSQTEIQFRGVRLQTPGLSVNIIRDVDLNAVDWPQTDFMLLQELEGTQGAGRRKYMEARLLYAMLSAATNASATRTFSNTLRYRMMSSERESRSSGFMRTVERVWHEYFRGNYGISPRVVLATTGVLWGLFSALYFGMGCLKVAWGAEYPTGLQGEVYSNARTRLITWRHGTTILSYSAKCAAFSLDQLLAIGAGAFKVGNIAEKLRLVPRHYVPVGVGRIVASIQNIVGLILLVFLARAILAAGIS